MTVRQTESRVSKIKNGNLKKSVTPKVSKNIFIKDLERDLARRLGTKVDITPKKKGGKLVVTYYSDEDLERIQVLIEKGKK